MKVDFKTTFDISKYGGQLFKADPFTIDTEVEIPGEASTAEGKEIQKLVGERWKKRMEEFKSSKEKEYKSILLETENNLKKKLKSKEKDFRTANPQNPLKAAADWMDEEAKGANVMIKGAVETFKGIMQKAMDETWDKVADEIDKKFKTKIRNQKIKAGFKIAGLAILVIAGAALAIAGAVLAGLASPTGIGLIAGIGIALSGIAATATAIKKIVDIANEEWPTHKKAQEKLKKSIEELAKALEYEEKKEAQGKIGDKADRKLGPVEKMKLFFGNTAGKRKDVGVAVKDMAMWNAKLMQSVEKYHKAGETLLVDLGKLDNKVTELAKKDQPTEKEIKEKKEIENLIKEGEKQLKELDYKIKNARIYLEKYHNTLQAAAEIITKEDKLTSSALGGFLGKLQELASSKEVGVLIDVGKGVAEFTKGLLKFLK